MFMLDQKPRALRHIHHFVQERPKKLWETFEDQSREGLINGARIKGMICQPDRTYVLTSADWLRTKVLCVRMRPQA
ncbi:hypothetical protein P7K49_029124 [Saguinus oedipus]|uniref:Uncharacterized protein n=1 Tax=Saguinus oedipus TaxID=9490 RepID=A0ABQ9U6B7_SAGOE|nr:hypothetical protein P7K49_029124 [Saguinus oedipus]